MHFSVKPPIDLPMFLGRPPPLRSLHISRVSNTTVAETRMRTTSVWWREWTQEDAHGQIKSFVSDPFRFKQKLYSFHLQQRVSEWKLKG